MKLKKSGSYRRKETILDIEGESIRLIQTRQTKRLRLSFDLSRRLFRVSAPWRFSLSQIEAFIRENQAFISRLRLTHGAPLPPPPTAYVLGDELFVFGKSYTVSKGAEHQRPFILLDETCAQICIRPSAGQTVLPMPKWVAWQKQQVQNKADLLKPVLLALTGEHDVSIKARVLKRMWGNCRVQTREIHLSHHLAEFPIRALRYVLIHELCHLKVPNHSPAFWALVTKYEPDVKAIKALLRRGMG